MHGSRRCPRPPEKIVAATTVALALVVLGTGPTGRAHAAPTQVDPDLAAADFAAYVLGPKDFKKVPGLKKNAPYESDGGSTPYAAPVTAVVGEPCDADTSPTFIRGSSALSTGKGADALVVDSRLGVVPDAEDTLDGIKSSVEGCTATYELGGTTLTPADPQPRVKVAGDGTVVFAVEARNRTEYMLWVRQGPGLLSSTLVVAREGSTELKRADLDALAKLMAKKLAALERSVRA